MKFTTKIYHPNIKLDSGEICADVIANNWAPTLNVRYVLNAIKAMLVEPNPDSPLEADIAQLYSRCANLVPTLLFVHHWTVPPFKPPLLPHSC